MQVFNRDQVSGVSDQVVGMKSELAVRVAQKLPTFQRGQQVTTGYGVQMIEAVNHSHGRYLYYFRNDDGYFYFLDEVTLRALQPKQEVAVGFSVFQKIYKDDYPYLSKVYRAAKDGVIDAFQDKNARKGGAWRVMIPKVDYEAWKLTQVESLAPAVAGGVDTHLQEVA